MIASALATLASSACAARYRAPALPQQELAVVKLDERARVLEVDGLKPPLDAEHVHEANVFNIGTGCRRILVHYEESYFIWGEDKAAKAGLGHGDLTAAINSEQHNYETFKPIQFFVPARATYAYWITASFTGDQFLPRVVELTPAGEADATFLPDQPCAGAAQSAAAPSKL